MVAWASTFSMRARSSAGTPEGRAGAASPPARAAGQSSTLTLSRTAQASVRAKCRLLSVDAEDAEAASRRLRIAAAPREHDVLDGLRPHAAVGLHDPDAALAGLAVPAHLIPVRDDTAPRDRRGDGDTTPGPGDAVGHGGERALGHDHPAITAAFVQERAEPLEARPRGAVVELSVAE